MRGILHTNGKRLLAILAVGTLFVSLVSLIATQPSRPVGAQGTTFAPLDQHKELDDRIKNFFEEIILNSNSSKAFDDLLPVSSVAGNRTIDDMKTKLNDIKKQFGEFRSFERIDVKSWGEDLVVVKYLLKCDSHPVVWTFTFYRRPSLSSSSTSPAGPWNVVGLHFDTNLDLLAL